jgi:hypothetical protein
MEIWSLHIGRDIAIPAEVESMYASTDDRRAEDPVCFGAMPLLMGVSVFLLWQHLQSMNVWWYQKLHERKL